MARCSPSITDEEILALRERNLQRARLAAQKMGRTWALHPSNSPKKSEERKDIPKTQQSVLPL